MRISISSPFTRPKIAFCNSIWVSRILAIDRANQFEYSRPLSKWINYLSCEKWYLWIRKLFLDSKKRYDVNELIAEVNVSKCNVIVLNIKFLEIRLKAATGNVCTVDEGENMNYNWGDRNELEILVVDRLQVYQIHAEMVWPLYMVLCVVYQMES